MVFKQYALIKYLVSPILILTSVKSSPNITFTLNFSSISFFDGVDSL